MVYKIGNEKKINQWNFVYAFIIAAGAFFLLISSLVDLQLVRGSEFESRSKNNQVNLSYIYPNRGVIYDRNDNKLAENIPATNLYLNLEPFYNNEGNFTEEDRLVSVTAKIEEIIGSGWVNASLEDAPKDSLFRYIEFLNVNQDESENYNFQSEILIATDLGNEETIRLKSLSTQYPEIKLEEGSKRYYPEGKPFSHLLGYVSVVTGDDLKDLDYLGYEDFVASNGYNDIIGQTGIENVYDRSLLGVKGIKAVEVDASGNITSDVERVVEEVKSGSSVKLSIDRDSQVKMYKLLGEAVKKYGATGGAAIVENVNSGELSVLATYPSYDNNDFVGGISQKAYDKLNLDTRNPLLNRPISAQLPPGSTFKTIAAVGALDSGAIDLNTVYVSRSGYTFSNGASFQEYHGNAYGALTVKDAISVSSNIFFCETIRHWDIDELDKYYVKFGIGSLTGIDLDGEAEGRLPSPKNKIALSKVPGVTWLEPIWYPEGDGCNTVIGQGITLVTPIQMSNWIAAIANGGTLQTPHLAIEMKDSSGKVEALKFEPIRKNLASRNAIKSVREGMRLAVAGPRRSIIALTDAKVHVAAKTGTAEFGALNSKGEYEHTHAWVTGFFPYENPEYSFSLLLEDGGESFHSAEVMRQFIDWFAAEGKLK
ncbi:hypothetical protein H6764_03585 [Candidatus Nomurabacteria bacterium]|nr:hypothetical protein [Candidatus Nomurabacteria bacterium]